VGDIRYKSVWQDVDMATRDEVIAFWRTYSLLPRRVDELARAAALCVVAYRGEDLVGVSTILIRQLPMLRARFAMFRCAVAPDVRQEGVAGQLAVRCRDVLEAWSAANPQQQVLGMACVVQGAELSEKKAQPFWPLSRMALAGYNDRGEQIRVVWFAHAKVD